MQSDRHAITEIITQLATSWASGELSPLAHQLAPEATLISNQHGMVHGPAELIQALAADTQCGPFGHRLSNLYIGVHECRAAASAYLFGLMQDRENRILLFGATLVTQFARMNQEWRASEVRLSVNWARGDKELVSHWLHTPSDVGWQPGDPAPVIVSELHAPWRVLPQAPVPERLDEALSELYVRYAFAVDQNDIGLLVSAYTEDIEGGFTPLGNLEGRDNVIGLLKSFRHLAPFWQHFADVLRVEAEGDGRHARMIVGRLIPERSLDEQGRAIYGAHYQIRARREADGQWRICWSDYRPGWFTECSVPAFDIGQATA